MSEPAPRPRGLLRLAGAAQVLVDLVAWTLAALLAVIIRFEFSIPDAEQRGLLRFLPVTAVVQVAVGLSIGLYRRRWRYGSFDEVAALVATAAISTAILFFVDARYLKPRPTPLSAVLVGGVVGLVFMAGIRYTFRLLLERRRRPSSDDSEALLVFGAGEGGSQVITAMRRTPSSPYVPVGILDDDLSKRRLSIMGVSVLGTRHDLPEVAARLGVKKLLIAVPSADQDLIAELTDIADSCGVSVLVLPPVQELFGNPLQLSDIRPLTEADLLGRHQIQTDLDAIAHYLSGKRVLVTGAGGSIGSELCRQIAQFGPAELVMLDRDESALHAVQLAIGGRALLDTPDVVLADLRDGETIHRLFLERRPDVVFHAAALKHLPMLEQYPSEAVQSNVIGTLTVLEAAQKAGVGRVVNISTDKAANPCSVLGYSKRLAERLTAEYARVSSTGTFLSVRFGNVLGSRGSVLTSFRSQIESGGPVTVTHPEVSRFFMTIQEAVQLVIQAGAIGKPGEVLVLDMGKPVRILDVARRLIAQSGRNVRIEFTGLRRGEKLHEELFGDGETDVRPMHPLISHAPVPPLSPIEVQKDTRTWPKTDVIDWLAQLCQHDLPA